MNITRRSIAILFLLGFVLPLAYAQWNTGSGYGGYSTSNTSSASTSYNTSSTSTASSNTSSSSTVPVATFQVISENNIIVNAITGGVVSVPGIREVISPGTYALIGNKTAGVYNFSLIMFNTQHVAPPNNNGTLTPSGAFAYAINGQITTAITMVNATGSPKPVTTFVAGSPSTSTTWTFLGGTFNGTSYTGGKYAFADIWKQVNSTTMVNAQFIKPVMWVFEAVKAPASNTTKPAPATTALAPSTATTPASSGSNQLVYVAIAIVVIAAVVYLYMKPKK